MGNCAVIRRRVIVTGLVQGVGFRYWTRREAQRLGLSGYVRNTASGRVEAEIEGDERTVADLVDTLHTGPPHARVESVSVTEIPAAGTDEFTVAG